ncbi:MAG: RNA polymerase sigma factor [Candidatus Dormibacteria bacterium]
MEPVDVGERLDGLRRGDSDAIAWMFSTFYGDVERCFGRRPAQDRADLVQDVFATAIVRLPTFQGVREASLRAWLRSIAFHRWHHRWEADQVRARHAGPALEALLAVNPGHEALADPDSDPFRTVAERDTISSVLGRLTVGQARVLRAHLVDGLTTGEIATDWGVPRERVRGLYKRAVAKLRSEELVRQLRLVV